MAEGIGAVQVAEQFWRKQAKENPSVGEYRGFLAECVRSLGHAERRLGHHDKALTLYLEVRGLLESLVKEHGKVAGFQEELARTCYYLGVVYAGQNQPAPALAALERSRGLRGEMLQVNPENLDVRDSQAATLRELGRLLVTQGQREEAIGVLEEAIAHQRVAVEKAPRIAGRCDRLHHLYNALIERCARWTGPPKPWARRRRPGISSRNSPRSIRQT